jgi:hypothetical protein
MDSNEIATLLLLAVTLAAQPWSVLAGIVLVSTRNGLRKEIAYVIGWILALSTVMALTLVYAPANPTTSSSSDWVYISEIFIGGLLMIVLAIRWRRGAPPGHGGAPSWLARVDSMPVLLALVLGAFLPNYFVVVPAGTTLLQSGLHGTTLVLAAIAFVLLASVGVAAPLGVLVVRRDRAPETYASWRDWILTHSRAVSYGTGALIAGMVVIQGLSALAT